MPNTQPAPKHIQRAKQQGQRARANRDFEGGETKSCPKCGISGDIDVEFGWRLMEGKIKPQSWCRSCRRSTRKM
jgi:hypothetical protein